MTKRLLVALLLSGCTQPLTRFLIDGGMTDGGVTDGGVMDGGMTDGGMTDGGTSDGGTSDGGMTDGGTSDGGTTDGGMSDGGTTDGGTTDAGIDAGLIDAGCPNTVTSCGGCGVVCPLPLNALPRCSADGGCGRGPCLAGAFDLEPGFFGCESTCLGPVCTLGDGGIVVLTAPPVPESGVTASTLASGSSHGAQVQTSTGHTNLGILGEPTPTGVEQTSATHRNVGGFNAELGRR